MSALAPSHGKFIGPLLEAGVDMHGRDPHDGCTVLHRAVWSGGHDKAVRALVQTCLNETDVNVADDAGNTPLHLRTVANTTMVNLLLKSGADVNAQNAAGETPLMFAARYQTPKDAARLIKKGADPDARTHDGRTVLHVAAREGSDEVVRWLLDRGLDPKVKNGVGETASDIAGVRVERRAPNGAIILRALSEDTLARMTA